MIPQHALVAVDYDDPVDALKVQLKAWKAETDAKLTIVGVAPKLSSSIRNAKVVSLAKDAEGMMINDLRDRLEELRDYVDPSAELHLLAGRTADEIIKAALLHSADLVVKSADKPIEEKLPLFGAVEKKLIRKCPVPVWIIRQESSNTPRTVAVAIDNTDHAANVTEAELLAESLVNHAVDLAKRAGIGAINIVHAWSPTGLHFLENPRSGLSPQEIESYVTEWQAVASSWLDGFISKVSERHADCRITFTPVLVMGDARQAVPRATAELQADILVIGSANRSGLPGLFIGNTAEDVIDRTKCGVYVVKPEGFSSIIADYLKR
ncbi:MAG: universal stress protein [Pseudomonadota bacterium]